MVHYGVVQSLCFMVDCFISEYVDIICMFFFFFKQKTAYEMRISDWSSDVCSSDLLDLPGVRHPVPRDDRPAARRRALRPRGCGPDPARRRPAGDRKSAV